MSAQNVEWFDVTKAGPVKEDKVDIIQVYYFKGFGRASPIDFLLNHANINYERKQKNAIAFVAGPDKKAFNSLPVCQRSDGTYMNETVPMARYISRVHGYYPTNPREIFRCDQIVEKFQPVIGPMDKGVFMFGGKKDKHEAMVCTELLPKFFKLLEEDMKEGWLIGDGSKIYMCDFFVGSIYADLIACPTSWMSKQKKLLNDLKAACPIYMAYGERFMKEN